MSLGKDVLSRSEREVADVIDSLDPLSLEEHATTLTCEQVDVLQRILRRVAPRPLTDAQLANQLIALMDAESRAPARQVLEEAARRLRALPPPAKPGRQPYVIDK